MSTPTMDKRTFVRDMFARIAPRYDLLNRLMTFGQDQHWRKRAAEIALAETGAPPRVLDLATGTGDLAQALRRVNPRAEVVGLDLTFEMLQGARAKRTRHGETWLLLNGDALDLPFPANSFDAIASAFMLRNVTDLTRAFEEMARVAKPNARIVALEITEPRLPLWRELYRFYFGGVIPMLGGMVSGDSAAYRYLPESLERFISPQELASIMTRAGLSDVQYALLNLGTVAIHWGRASRNHESD